MAQPLLDRVGTALLPLGVRRWIRRQQIRYGLQNPRMGTVEWGGLRRTSPISPVFALDRGLAVDRYYIEQFLTTYTGDIHGRVLEMMDPFYTQKFGGAQVTRSDVMHSVAGNPHATIVGDLTRADEIPSDLFDCIIFTQTLEMIYDLRVAMGHLQRILKPSGALLVTVPGITKIARREGVDAWGEYWHFTAQSAKRLFEEFYPPSNVRVHVYGNVLTALAMLHGMAIQELAPPELDFCDPDYEVLIAIRAVKG